MDTKNRIIKITDYHAPELDIYARDTESMLLHYYEPHGGLFIAESPKVISRAVKAGCEPVSFLLEPKMLPETGQKEKIDAGRDQDQDQDQDKNADPNLPEALRMQNILSDFPDVPVYTADLDVLMKITGYKLTRGALCAMKRPKLPTAADICLGIDQAGKNGCTETEQSQLIMDDEKSPKNNESSMENDALMKNAAGMKNKALRKRIAILDNLENPTNVGAIFRNAAALGIDGILLTKNCADPLFRRAARVSVGTVFQIPWTYIKEPEEIKAYGFKTAAMALTERAVSIEDPALMAEEKLAIILGNEGGGLSEDTIKNCDHVVMIPMYHEVDSLNVASASAVVFWQLCKKPV